MQLAVCGRCESRQILLPPGTLPRNVTAVCARLFHQDCLLRRQPKLLCDNCCRPDHSLAASVDSAIGLLPCNRQLCPLPSRLPQQPSLCPSRQPLPDPSLHHLPGPPALRLLKAALQLLSHGHAFTLNTSWCFACLRSGGLSGCQRCPASYHIACLPDSPISRPSCGSVHLHPCRLSWQPRCGDIVWVKVGPFRLVAPARSCWHSTRPENIQRLGRQLGTFPVASSALTRRRIWASSAAAAADRAGTETAELMDKFNEGGLGSGGLET
uniref:Phorbol-ester/DAG-type domain-containing protein n=1 Tax=Macrostomum lignano TaxID=282301 RepID=A0A1I8JNL2_9PLAT